MKAKKSLGQNWLTSPSALKKMIEAADLRRGELVLEIGPGQGRLTEALLAAGVYVISIEKDNRLIEFLSEKFASALKAKQLVIIHDDILKIDFSQQILPSIKSFFPNSKELKTYKLVANLPYYITSQVTRKFLNEEKIQPRRIVLMLQKEVAKRIVAQNGKESLLSLSVKVFGEPKYLKTIPAGAFFPKPKVDSAILLIQNISRQNLEPTKDKDFFELLHQGFAQKRKKLKNCLSLSEKTWLNCNLDPNLRAEDLTLADWLCLSTADN